MIMQQRLGAAALALVLTVIGLAGPARAAEVTVFAAASLTNAMEDVGALYREKTGEPLRFSFASSSTLARQIEAGAPAQIYASANEKWMDTLDKAGLVADGTRVSPISNSLVLIAPEDSDLEPVAITKETDLAALLGTDGRMAVGDPDHVPAGIYAAEALRALGQWDALEPRLARADDVRAALALVARGEVPLGIVYGTDAAISEKVKVLGTFPAGSHKPITYPFAIVAGNDTPAVRAVFDFIVGPEALKVFERYGFTRNR